MNTSSLVHWKKLKQMEAAILTLFTTFHNCRSKDPWPSCYPLVEKKSFGGKAIGRSGANLSESVWYWIRTAWHESEEYVQSTRSFRELFNRKTWSENPLRISWMQGCVNFSRELLAVHRGWQKTEEDSKIEFHDWAVHKTGLVHSHCSLRENGAFDQLVGESMQS